MCAEQVHELPHTRAPPLRAVALVEPGHRIGRVAPPVVQHARHRSGFRIHGRAGQHRRGDEVRPGGRHVRGDLGAAGVPGDDHRRQLHGRQPVAHRLGEPRHVHPVRWVAAVGQSGQVHQVGLGPVERGLGGRQVVRDGHAHHGHHRRRVPRRPEHAALAGVGEPDHVLVGQGGWHARLPGQVDHDLGCPPPRPATSTWDVVLASGGCPREWRRCGWRRRGRLSGGSSPGVGGGGRWATGTMSPRCRGR